jgi:hypothetical protein
LLSIKAGLSSIKNRSVKLAENIFN